MKNPKIRRFETSTSCEESLSDEILNNYMEESSEFSNDSTLQQEEKLSKLESQISKLVNMKQLIQSEMKQDAAPVPKKPAAKTIPVNAKPQPAASSQVDPKLRKKPTTQIPKMY
jgi:hypothetical protein